MRVVLLATAVAWLASAAASARECLGINFPEQLQLQGTALALNGLGARQATIFKVNVYVAALYVPRKSADAAGLLAARAPYVMQMHFVRNVGAADIAKGWTEGFERNAQGGLPATDPRVAALRSWMVDIKSGQEMKFTFRPGAGVEGTVDGTAKGMIPGDDFARALLSVWLGRPPNPEIKAGLLGGPCD
jgi:hypothetical protein